MSNKVLLPKEVAEAIEAAREDEKGDARLIQAACSAERIIYGYDRVIHEWCKDDNLIRFVCALVNGYEVEETPEDKVRARYKEAVKEENFHQEKSQTVTMEYWNGYHSGIYDCLNDLNIKIEGVNAE